LAISLGAKFWYDLLRQLVNFRGSQPAAQQAPTATVTTTTTAAPILTKPGTGLFESTRRKAPEKKEDEEVKG